MNKLHKMSNNENSQFIFNFISTTIRSGVTFLTMPIFTRLLGAEQYGKYSIYISWLTICACLMGLNVGSALGTGVYQYRDSYKTFRTSLLIEGTLGCFILMAFITIFSKQLSRIKVSCPPHSSLFSAKYAFHFRYSLR